MTRIVLPYKRPSVMPAMRKDMPTRAKVYQLGPGVRLVPFNAAGLPPHYHIDIDAAPEKKLIRLDTGFQAAMSSVPRALISCEQLGCSWFAFGKDGEDEGAPFKHPQGVECGDAERCPDPNCPCPRNVYSWMSDQGRMHANVAPCRFCDGTFRFATATGVRPVSFDEYFYRLDEGVDSLITIRKRGL